MHGSAKICEYSISVNLRENSGDTLIHVCSFCFLEILTNHFFAKLTLVIPLGTGNFIGYEKLSDRIAGAGIPYPDLTSFTNIHDGLLLCRRHGKTIESK